MADIYGVDPNQQNITPLMVRDAMVRCFFAAHCKDSGITPGVGDTDEATTRNYCREIVKQAFQKSQGDFDRPTRASILGAMAELRKMAANFRSPEEIAKHVGEIMTLVEKLPEA